MKHLMLVILFLTLGACGKKQEGASELVKQKSILYTDISEPNENEEEVTSEETAEETTTTSNRMTCDFTNTNDQVTFGIEVSGTGANRTAVLSSVESGGKLTFDGYNFSPSGNENAAVTHENKDELVEEGKVIKITARILMNESINEGQLQVSYKIKNEDNSITETEFKKIAEIDNCVLN